MLFRTSSVLILETGMEREILLRQSGPDIRTNFARPGPSSKLVNTARGSYRMSSIIKLFGRFCLQTMSIISLIKFYHRLSVFVIRSRGLTALVLLSVWVCAFFPRTMETPLDMDDARS